MAEDREKLVQQQTQKMAEERNKIETFADFGNMYNFKKILPIPTRPTPA